MKKDLRFAICNSSALTFALQRTWFDVLLSLALAGTAGFSAYVWSGETSIARRVLLSVLAALSTYSLVVIVRALVPFVLRISFAHMMRLRLPFYLWIVSLVVTAGLRGSSDSFSALGPAAFQLTLLLLSLMLTVRFFRDGSLLRLALAFACAGGAVGLSALGLLAPVMTLVLLWLLSHKVLREREPMDWVDKPHHKVVDYFTNPLVQSRTKWVFVGCFTACGALAFHFLLNQAGDFSGAGQLWIGHVGWEDTAFLLMTAILPLVVGIGKSGPTSDVSERTGFGCLALYMAIAPLTALMMLHSGFVLSLLEFDPHIEDRVLALASVIYVFNLLLAGMIILADVRCRDFRGVRGVRTDSLRGVMRFSYAVVTLAPLVMVGTAVFLSLR